MNIRKIISNIFIFLLKVICRSRKNRSIPVNPKNILVIRQHNQFGDMLATIPLFRAIKENYPGSVITLIASPENYFAVRKNKYIDILFNFDKKLLLEADYIRQFLNVLRKGYDIVLVPVTVSVSSTSCIMAWLAKSHISIGPSSLNGIDNKLSFLFDISVEMDWRKDPGMNVSRFSLEILKPLNITTSDYSSHVSFDKDDKKQADLFLEESGFLKSNPLVGFHIGAGKPPNRWPLANYVSLIERLETDFRIEFYFTGSSSDNVEIEFMKKQFGNSAGYFLNRTIPELAALISKSNLFITNDTGVMHVAGAVNTAQISIFGPTDPKNWAPIGRNKTYIRKGESINKVSVEDVLDYANKFLTK